jgi:hypothetical protein
VIATGGAPGRRPARADSARSRRDAGRRSRPLALARVERPPVRRRSPRRSARTAGAALAEVRDRVTPCCRLLRTWHVDACAAIGWGWPACVRLAGSHRRGSTRPRGHGPLVVPSRAETYGWSSPWPPGCPGPRARRALPETLGRDPRAACRG